MYVVYCVGYILYPYDADNLNINGYVGLVLCYGIKDGMSIGEYWVSFNGAR